LRFGIRSGQTSGAIGRHRTAFQRAKRQEAAERTVRIDRILSFLRDEKIPVEMSEGDLRDVIDLIARPQTRFDSKSTPLLPRHYLAYRKKISESGGRHR